MNVLNFSDSPTPKVFIIQPSAVDGINLCITLTSNDCFKISLGCTGLVVGPHNIDACIDVLKNKKPKNISQKVIVSKRTKRAVSNNVGILDQTDKYLIGTNKKVYCLDEYQPEVRSVVPDTFTVNHKPGYPYDKDEFIIRYKTSAFRRVRKKHLPTFIAMLNKIKKYYSTNNIKVS